MNASSAPLSLRPAHVTRGKGSHTVPVRVVPSETCGRRLARTGYKQEEKEAPVPPAPKNVALAATKRYSLIKTHNSHAGEVLVHRHF